MNEKGLDASIWATGRGGRGGGSARASGDWLCIACGFDNFAWRVECFRCNRSRGVAPVAPSTNGIGAGANAGSVVGERGGFVGGGNGLNEGSHVGDHWEQKGSAGSGGQVLNGGNRKSIIGDSTMFGDASMLGDLTRSNSTTRWNNGCQAAANGSSIVGGSLGQSASIASNGSGLATSRWAPRNYDGRHNGGGQVWTRVAPIPKPITQPTSRPPTPPDLGLPYEVQHYILSMMQRILEEGCWDFASRWVPTMLLSRNWTCSEAVELSAWKKFLPSAIPYNALSGTISLETALTDAVRIRNAAVHRHLCDNREIRVMAIRAGDLMALLGDGSRKEKFWRLKEELSRWDEGVRGDRELARRKLEEALRVVGERDMDDMDWTPNAVSLQEIIINGDVHVNGLVNGDINGAEGYVDEMELD